MMDSQNGFAGKDEAQEAPRHSGWLSNSGSSKQHSSWQAANSPSAIISPDRGVAEGPNDRAAIYEHDKKRERQGEKNSDEEISIHPYLSDENPSNADPNVLIRFSPPKTSEDGNLSLLRTNLAVGRPGDGESDQLISTLICRPKPSSVGIPDRNAKVVSSSRGQWHERPEILGGREDKLVGLSVIRWRSLSFPMPSSQSHHPPTVPAIARQLKKAMVPGRLSNQKSAEPYAEAF